MGWNEKQWVENWLDFSQLDLLNYLKKLQFNVGKKFPWVDWVTWPVYVRSIGYTEDQIYKRKEGRIYSDMALHI